jgi:hypothetical protein
MHIPPKGLILKPMIIIDGFNSGIVGDIVF